MATETTMPALQPPAGQVSNFVNPDYNGAPFVAVSSVFLALAVISLTIRVWTRVFLVGNFGTDDYLMITALVCSVVLTAVTLDMTQWGLGLHMWDVPLAVFSPHFLQRNVAAASIYCAATGFTKCSVLVFYTRIFPSRKFHTLVWILVFIAAGYSFASVFVNIFGCQPIEKGWDASITTGKCLNSGTFYFANAGLGIFTDFATVAVPIPWLRRLQMPLRQKIAVASILAMGCTVGIVSCIRLDSLYLLMKTADLTWNTTNALMWCNIELNLGITGGCVTAMRPFIRQYFPRFLGSSADGNYKSRSQSNYPLGSVPRSDQPYFNDFKHQNQYSTSFATRHGADNDSEEHILSPGPARAKEPDGIIRTVEFDIENSSVRRD